MEGKHAKHPDHTKLLPRIRRVGGQISGIERMIEEKRYCVDILTQFQAAIAALKAVEIELLKGHLGHCVSQAVGGSDLGEAEKKIAEITELLERRV
jgi:DNA-binding FrmR family transcriptional regulator